MSDSAIPVGARVRHRGNLRLAGIVQDLAGATSRPIALVMWDERCRRAAGSDFSWMATDGLLTEEQAQRELALKGLAQ